MKKSPTPLGEKSITVRVPASLKRSIAASAKAADLNVGQYVRRAISAHQDQEEAKK